jgi:Xaa-Pro aminopeptidase
MNKDLVRINSLRTLIESKKLDALIFFHPENILLSTAMLPGAPFTISIITKTGNVIVVCPWWRKEEVASQSWADKIVTFNWLKDLNGADPVKEIYNELTKLRNTQKIQKIGYDADLGCLMPSYTPSSHFTYTVLKSGLVETFNNVMDVSPDIHKLRAIKTDCEIKKIKKANLVAKESAKAFYRYAKEGVREVDVAAEILKSVQMQTGINGVRYTYCDPPQITSGVKRTFKANPITCPATNKKLKKGELVMLELGGCADGYWFDLTRTLVVGGKPKPIQMDMAYAIKSASQAAYDAYKNGQSTGSELTKAAFAVLKKKGFGKGIMHGIGHGVGFGYHEATPGIGPGSEDVIQTGMITSMEPGLYLPEIGGIRIEENVLWGNNSVTILSDFHNDLGNWHH